MSELITDADIAEIEAILEDLSDVTEEPITYKTYTGLTPGDQLAGTPATPTYTTDLTTTSAMARELTLEEVRKSGGAYELGDMEFIVRRLTKPDYKDRIVYDGGEYRPKSRKRLFLKKVLWWELVAGKE
ncbi:MAG: hypothetical protein WA118_08295 [Carboxydocellales bacterium]